MRASLLSHGSAATLTDDQRECFRAFNETIRGDWIFERRLLLESGLIEQTGEVRFTTHRPEPTPDVWVRITHPARAIPGGSITSITSAGVSIDGNRVEVLDCERRESGFIVSYTLSSGFGYAVVLQKDILTTQVTDLRGTLARTFATDWMQRMR